MTYDEAVAYLNSIPFQAARYTGSWFGKPTLLVVHDMEAGEFSTTAESCANFMANYPTPPPKAASINYSIDNNSAVCSALPGRETFHAGVGSINRCSSGTEFAGFANQTYDQWKDDYSYAMIWGVGAKLFAAQCIVFGIFPNFLDANALRRGERNGITTHWEITKAFNVSGGHTDPGPNFPVTEFINAIRAIISPAPIQRKTDMADTCLLTNNKGVITEFRARGDGHLQLRYQVAPNGVYGNWGLLIRSITTWEEVHYVAGIDNVVGALNGDGRMELRVWHSAFPWIKYLIVQNPDNSWRDQTRLD